MPKFSIIIPSYNRADFLLTSINSSLNQEYTDFEVIVVDDASTDNTEEMVNSIKSDKLTYIRKTVNGERSAARNTGTQVARGEFVYFHDSDDVLYPNHLKEAYKLLQINPEAVFFAFAYQITNGTRLITKINNYAGDLNKKLIGGNFLSCKAFVKREIALQFLFNEARNLSEDYELWLKLAARFKLYGNSTITSALILHSGRSVQHHDPPKLIENFVTLEADLEKDPEVFSVYKKYFRDFKSDNLSYISLHLVISGHRKMAFKFLILSFLKSPLRLISTKRFYAIIKKFVLTRIRH